MKNKNDINFNNRKFNLFSTLKPPFMKCFLKLVLTILFVVVSHQGYAQEFSGKSNVSNEDSNVKPIRIGAKLGFPNLISLNLEYVLPILDNKLAVSADISKINSSSVADGYFGSNCASRFGFIARVIVVQLAPLYPEKGETFRFVLRQ